MIFVEKTLEEWIKKHPSLKVIETKCDNCGEAIVANKPFVTKGCAGLAADKCVCGKNRHTCSISVTTSEEEYNKWMEVLTY